MHIILVNDLCPQIERRQHPAHSLGTKWKTAQRISFSITTHRKLYYCSCCKLLSRIGPWKWNL